jgi:hypothetical protein
VHMMQVASRAQVVHVAAAAKPTVTDKVGMCSGLQLQMGSHHLCSPSLRPPARLQQHTVCRLVLRDKLTCATTYAGVL